MYMSDFKGDSRLEPYVSFSRNKKKYCIYCGQIAETREHCPSKCFLRKPFPTNLPVLPSCAKCNNSFSNDELYTRAYIVFSKKLSEGSDDIASQLNDLKKAEKDAYSAINDFSERGFDARVGRILAKLAIGHIVYELSEGYFGAESSFVLKRISYLLKNGVSEDYWNDLDKLEKVDIDVLPEVGSRIYRNIYVLSYSDGKKLNDEKTVQGTYLDWTNVQEESYKYKCILKGEEILVKIKILQFLYAEVTFSREQ